VPPQAMAVTVTIMLVMIQTTKMLFVMLLVILLVILLMVPTMDDVVMILFVPALNIVR
jgi:hypothetical protein